MLDNPGPSLSGRPRSIARRGEVGGEAVEAVEANVYEVGPTEWVDILLSFSCRLNSTDAYLPFSFCGGCLLLIALASDFCASEILPF